MNQWVQSKINALQTSLAFTEYGISKLCKDIYFLNGMSSPKVRRLMNNLGSFSKRYCEVGSWRGSTLISTAYGNELDFILAIDDFSQFREEVFCANPLVDLLPEERKSEFLYASLPQVEIKEKLNRFQINAKLIEESFVAPSTQSALKSFKTEFDLYLFDGDHAYQSQYDGVKEMYEYMADVFILCVDDWMTEAQPEVRTGTFDALNALNANIRAQWEGFSRGNGDIDNYWNGFFVAVIEK